VPNLGYPSQASPAVRPAAPGKTLARPRRGLWTKIKRNKWAYIFISPFYLLFAIFGLFPPLYAFYLSFHEWDIINPMEYVGFRNYARVLADGLFWKSFTNNIILILMATVPVLVFALIIATWLDTYIRRLRNLFLAAFFSPMVTSSVAVAIVFGLMYGLNYGLINAGLRAIGLTPVRWLTQPAPMKFALAFLLIWRWLGWNVVFYLAGLQAISQEYYEAAKVDGATGRQLFLHITVPLMRPVILYTLALAIIGMLQLFVEPYLLTGSALTMGGRDNSLLTMVIYLYQNAFGYFRFGYASAVSYVIFVLILFFSTLNIRLLDRPQ
jgi:ABC-type sugar transport system permease subunit